MFFWCIDDYTMVKNGYKPIINGSDNCLRNSISMSAAQHLHQFIYKQMPLLDNLCFLETEMWKRHDKPRGEEGRAQRGNLYL